MLGAVPSPGRVSPKDEHSEELPTRSCAHHSLQQLSKHLVYYLNQQFSTGDHSSPQGTLAMSADALVVMTGEGELLASSGRSPGMLLSPGQHHHREFSVPQCEQCGETEKAALNKLIPSPCLQEAWGRGQLSLIRREISKSPGAGRTLPTSNG